MAPNGPFTPRENKIRANDRGQRMSGQRMSDHRHDSIAGICNQKSTLTVGEKLCLDTRLLDSREKFFIPRIPGGAAAFSEFVQLANPDPSILKYTLTRICSVEYIKSVESVFEIIAEPNRRAILSLLVSSQQSVGEIERQLRLTQPTVSKHLRVLRDAGFVESTVDAQRRLYRLKPKPFQEVDAWLAQFRRFWSFHIDALERHLDRMDQSNQSTPTKRKTKEKPPRPKPRT
jgi:DNA-binding transcriptional ArsR family regulator